MPKKKRNGDLRSLPITLRCPELLDLRHIAPLERKLVFLDLSCINPIRHMSPRWGFRIFACLVCYKHAALLGLGWFISNKVDFGKSAYRSPKWFQVH